MTIKQHTNNRLNSSPYPVDMSFVTLDCGIDAARISYQPESTYHPTHIAQYALAHWNLYPLTHNEQHEKTFIAQANWLVEHERRIGEDASGWPLSYAHPEVHTKGPWLSASAQGSGLSVLTRAYKLTGEDVFLEAAQRVVRTFERDILDGGIHTPIGEDGIFFEEVAVYPAAHMFNGFIFALLGLYDYVSLTGDPLVTTLIQRGIETLHYLLDEFDTGFWVCSDLLQRHLSTPSQLAFQIKLLEALATLSHSEDCTKAALRWKEYARKPPSRLRSWIIRRRTTIGHALLARIRKKFFPPPPDSGTLRICIPINAFPVTGGVATVLSSISEVTGDSWHIEYLTRYKGPNAGDYVIHQFGTARMDPWHFPTVWVYVWDGWRKLLLLMHHGAGYSVILPQDGVFSAAFSALASKLTGIRTVCIDHANLTLLQNPIYRDERRRALAAKSRAFQLLARPMLALYWPALNQIARIAGRSVDHFLVPGVPGDGVEEICQHLGIPSTRLTRFNSMIDLNRHVVLDQATRAKIREQKGLNADAIVIAVVCRLAPEKGLEVTAESLSLVLSQLEPALRIRLHVVIAGDGPLRKQLEDDIHRRRLEQVCTFWGDISPEEVFTLLSISDIFLYTSTRGACFPMAVLEAMASGCAVIASKQPISNAHLLAGGRGIAVAEGNAVQTGEALAQLIRDAELRQSMGKAARAYIRQEHSPAMFRRTLQRLTSWSALDELLTKDKS